MSIPERIEKKIVPITEGGCWIWIGELNRNGYGRIKIFGKRLMAHRVIYELLVGAIPERLVLDHLCKNRCCVNPNHLEPVTVKENTHRGNALLFIKKDFE